MLWHRQAIFKSKGDELCFSAECRIWTRGPRHQIARRLNARWQTDWAIEDQAKNLNSTARPYYQRAFSPLDPTVSWLLHLTLAIYIFVVVHFDALAQASDIQIERRQVVFLCWMQDLNTGSRHQIASRLNARWQTDWAIEDQAKTWTRQPVHMISEHSAHLTPLSVDFRTWFWRYTYLLLFISKLWQRQAIFKSKGEKLRSSAECRIWTRGPRHQIASRLNARWQTDWAIEDQAKNLNTKDIFIARCVAYLCVCRGWCRYLFLLMKHHIFLSNITVLPFANITPHWQGLCPETSAILSLNKSCFMLRNPETKYIAFNDVQITLAYLA